MENQRKGKAIEIQNTKISTSNVLPELNNDCLLYIFSFLPIMDRIRIQRVCKRWQKIGNLPWQDMKKLDFCEATWTTHSRQIKLSKKILQQVFQLCGGFLREIRILFNWHLFCEIPEDVERVFVVLLRDFCPNIQIVNFQDVESYYVILSGFANYFKCITKFSVESYIFPLNSPYSYENTLGRFFQSNGNLRSLRLCSIRLQDICLKYLPFQIIEEIIIDYCYIKKSELDSISKLELSNLKTFSFKNNLCDNLTDIFELLSALLSPAQSNLKKLEIELNSVENLIFESTTKLHHLEALMLIGGILSDDLLMSVSKNYKNLIRVELSSSNNVTDASLIQVLSLQHLQHVKLYDMDSITDNVLLTIMLKLKSLECAECPLLQNDGFRAVMESSKNLENLWVYKCEKVSTTTLIKDAVQITKNRKSNLKLKLRVLLNEVCKVINDSPLLQIVEHMY